MTWGHAISRDLLHWQEMDPVLFPDQHGTIFSGSGICNSKGMLGLPESALVFFYTAAGSHCPWSAGKAFTQRIAYSLDGGKSLVKVEEPAVDVLHREDRDPKVIFHEESDSYIMVLWLKDSDYAIFRSSDLMNWAMTQELCFPETWECPDLFRVKVEESKPDEMSLEETRLEVMRTGEKKPEEYCWFFWTACGKHFAGEFDGYTFKSHGQAARAHLTDLPYASQTWSNTGGRLISIPWLRLKNDGRNFTSAMGIPVAFTASKLDSGDGYRLIQKPVRELEEALVPLTEAEVEDILTHSPKQGRTIPLCIKAELDPVCEAGWSVNGTEIVYQSAKGLLEVDGTIYRVDSGCRDLQMIIDDNILEIFMDGGSFLGAFQLKSRELSLDLEKAKWEKLQIFAIGDWK